MLRSIHYISMQGPLTPTTDQAEAPIPTETVSMSNGSTMKAEASISIETVSDGNGPNIKAEAPIPTETVSMSNGPFMKTEAPIPTETVSLSNSPTMKAEAPIATETVSVSNDSNMNCTVTNSRKAAKRTLPWDQVAGELLVSEENGESIGEVAGIFRGTVILMRSKAVEGCNSPLS